MVTPVQKFEVEIDVGFWALIAVGALCWTALQITAMVLKAIN